MKEEKYERWANHFIRKIIGKLLAEKLFNVKNNVSLGKYRNWQIKKKNKDKSKNIVHIKNLLK